MVLAHTIGPGGGTGGTGGTGSTGSGGTTSVTSGGTFSSVPSAVSPPASTKQVWLQFNNPFMPDYNNIWNDKIPISGPFQGINMLDRILTMIERKFK